MVTPATRWPRPWACRGGRTRRRGPVARRGGRSLVLRNPGTLLKDKARYDEKGGPGTRAYIFGIFSMTADVAERAPAELLAKVVELPLADLRTNGGCHAEDPKDVRSC